MLPRRIWAAHPGKGFMKVSTSQVFLDHFVHHRPKEPILFLTILIIAGLEVFIMIAEYFPQGRIGGLPGVINW